MPPALTLREMLARLRDEGRLGEPDIERIGAYMAAQDRTAADPLYIRLLAGGGAWLSALFLLLAFGMAGLFEHPGTMLLCGALMLTSAAGWSRLRSSTFIDQLTLALVLAGHSLTLAGSVRALDPSFSALGVLALLHPLLGAAVYPLYAGSIYRFLTPVVAAGLGIAWIMDTGAHRLIHALVAVEMVSAGVLWLRARRPAALTPLRYAALLALPATLLVMTVALTDPMDSGFHEPLWPSSLLLTGGLVYLYGWLGGEWAKHPGDASPLQEGLEGGRRALAASWMGWIAAGTLLLGLFTTPGILVAIGLLVIGYAFDDREVTALAYLFLICFLVLFYYALNIDLAHKAWVIAGSGALLLALRQLAGRGARKEGAS